MTTHELKSWPEYFNLVQRNLKTFELRFDDRGYEEGDLLHLREWVPNVENPKEGKYTGRVAIVKVLHIARPVVGDLCVLAIKEGWALMSIRQVEVS